MAREGLAGPVNWGFWFSLKGFLLVGAALSGAVAWWLIAWPVASLANIADHQGHFMLIFAHMLGGTGMLSLGALNLYLAARKDHFRLHRRIGQAYLAFGAFAATLALVITLSPAHKSAGGSILTNSTVSLATLATAWLAFAGLGWRAARNRRYANHGDWMIRSYVLVWSFVFCRLRGYPRSASLATGKLLSGCHGLAH